MLGRVGSLPSTFAALRGRVRIAHSSLVSAGRLEDGTSNRALRQRLVDFHRKAGDAEQEDGEQEMHILRWLEEHATRNGLRGVAKQLEVESMVRRYVEHSEPLAYILGSQPFGPIEVLCQRPTLIPRPETEFLVEHAAGAIVEAFKKGAGKETASPLRVLDLCTGSGCIALLMNQRLQEAQVQAEVVGIDNSESAVDLANRNVLALKAQKTTAIVKVDIFNDEEMTRLCTDRGPFDVVLTNPPYIPFTEWQSLDKNVRDWEDPAALVGDGDGLTFYRRIAVLAKKRDFICPRFDGMPNLVVEVGHQQARHVQDILVGSRCFHKTELWDDPWRVTRGVMGWKNNMHG
ncbi:hypothetical protein CBS101457_001918 [Exobasidium rhododendri]|nr:hypothetical protein CBS101457_001918 [Exobasidium rhododendri]